MPPMSTWFGGPDGGHEELRDLPGRLSAQRTVAWKPIRGPGQRPAGARLLQLGRRRGRLPAVRAQRAHPAAASKISDVTAFITRSIEDPDPGACWRGCPSRRSTTAAWRPRSGTSASRSASTEAGPGRLLGLGLPRLARRASTPRSCRSASGFATTRAHFDTVEINNTFYRLPLGERGQDVGRGDAAPTSASRSRRAATSPTSSG